LLVHKILPKKKLFVDDVLKETKSKFGAFKFVFYLDGQIFTLEQEKKSTTLFINNKPFYSYQNLPKEQTHERLKACPLTSLDQIEIGGLNKQVSQFACKLSNQKTFEENCKIYDKEKANDTRKVVSEMVLKEETSKIKTEFGEMKTKAENSKNIISQVLIVIKEDDNLKPKNETKKNKKSDCKEECVQNQEFDENKEKDHNEYKFNEEIEEEILKMDKVFGSDANQERIVKDMDLTRRNLAKINVFKVLLFIN